jgi:hypothetical protein
LPELVRQGCDVGMSERGDAVSNRGSFVRRLMSFRGVLEGQPRMFVPSEVILFSVLLGDTMGVRRQVLQFGCPRMILVMRSVVIASRHN